MRVLSLRQPYAHVVLHYGKMIENLHVDNARRLLAQADAIAALSQA